jgi:hypothetical protein
MREEGCMAIVNTVPTSGSVGNITYSRVRGQQTIRQRAVPINPRTPAQVAARQRLGTDSAAWRGLTAAQQAAWTAFGNSFTVQNSLGTSIHLTGLQCYVKVNSTNALNGNAVVSVPPSLPSFIAVTTTGITATAGTQALSVTGTSPASGTVYMIYASPLRSPGAQFENQYKWMQTFTAATSGAFNILAPYTAQYGALAIGKKIFVKVVQSQAGMQDNGTVYSATITT